MSTESDAAKHASEPHLSFLTEPTGDAAIDSDLEYIRNLNWADTAPGPISTWPRELLVLVNLALLSPQPQLFLLGPDSIILYNTAYGRLLRDCHPLYQAQAPAISRIRKRAKEKSELANENHVIFFFPQDGRLEEVFLSATMVQLPLSLDGYHATTYNTTREALQVRREHALDEIRHATKDATELPALWTKILEGISNADGDISFAVIYYADCKLVRDKDTDFVSNDVSTKDFFLAGTVGSFSTPLPSNIRRGEDQPWVRRVFGAVDSHESVLLQADDGTMPPEMRHASSKRCYGDDSHQAVILPSVMDKASSVHAVLILGLAPRRPYDNFYQAWVRTLHYNFCNTVAAITMVEARLLAKENDHKRIAKEKEVFAKEVHLKQQEAALATGKMRRMLEIMEAASVGVFECTLSGKLTQTNEAFCNLSGCSKDLRVQHHTKLVELCEPEDMSLLKSHWQALLGGQPTTVSVKFRPRGQEKKWVQVACVPVFDNSLNVISITGCVTDIDAQKKVEHEAIVNRAVALEQLHLSESRLLNLIENAPLGILIFDQNRQPSFVNKTWFQMTGHPPVPVPDVEVRSIIFPEDIPEFDARLEDISRTGRPDGFHVRLNRLWQGASDLSKQAWVRFTGFPEMVGSDSFQITTAITDISDFKFSEALQRTRLEEAVEARRQQENFVDMTSHEIRNPLSAVMHCTDSLAHSLSEVKLLMDHINYRSPCDVDTAITMKRLQDFNSNMVDAVETIMSCTMHQKRIIDDILSLSKLDSNLLEICPTTFQVKSFLSQVESTFKLEAAQAGVTLVTVPDVSLSQLGIDWIEADPGRILQVLVNLVVNAIKFTKDSPEKRNVTLRIGASTSPPVDVFLDLTMAASSSSDRKSDSTLGSKTTGQGIYLWCSVKDTGCGMDTASMARIFSRFTQASPKTYSKYGGSGLGLFISRKLAALQGGEIGFASQENVGSTFAFYVKASRALPPNTTTTFTATDGPAEVKNAHIQPSSALAENPEPHKKPQLSVLLVEDNLVNQRVLKKQLERHGYKIYTADNGQEAFDFVKTTRHWRNFPDSVATGPYIDVILMDVEMPIVDGLQCASMIRTAEKEGQIDKHLQIIAVTANARPEQLRRATEAGMDDAVSKPFRVKDLALVIEQLGALGPGTSLPPKMRYMWLSVHRERTAGVPSPHMSPGLNALFLELPNLHRGNPPARLPDQVSPGAEPGKAFALADANEQEMEVKESEEAHANLLYDTVRRLNLLESETARLLLENAQLKGANKKVRNAKQRHLAAQPRMKKECDDALAGLQEQRNINGDVRAALKTEQSGGPRMLTEMEYHQAKMYEDMWRGIDICNYKDARSAEDAMHRFWIVMEKPASVFASAATIRPQSGLQSQPGGQHLAMSGNTSQGPGLRYPSNKKTIYDRNLNRSKNAELSRAAFAYLFIEMIAYAQKGAKDVGDLEQRLNTQGYPIGLRLLDLLLSRTANPLAAIRPTRILPLLQFIAQQLYRYLFGRPADALEKSGTDPGQYMLFDNEPMVNQYISLPKELSSLNCAAFVAGIIEGVCDGAGLPTEGVTAHSVGEEEGKDGKGLWPGKTVFLIKFKPEVLEREEILGRASASTRDGCGAGNCHPVGIHPSKKHISAGKKQYTLHANTTAMPTEISAPLHFRTLLNVHTYLIADFYATWCPPCKQIAPIYAQLSSTHSAAGKFAFVKVNVDEQRELAGQYGVTAMPTFMLFKDGKKVEEVRGADVRGLKGMVERVAGEVRATGGKVEEKVGKKAVEKEEEGKVEEKTVSGSYGMTVIALLPAIASASAVIDLEPSNFDDIVLKSGKPALVEFFAPWCGHCKNLAPVWEELATVFQHAGDKVSVAKVDADNHKALGKRFGVTGFPTLKWFDGKSDKPTDYKGGRDLESLSKFITENTSIKPKVKGKLPSQVVYLDDKSFKEKVGKDQDVLVAFTAPWCGHCKTLAPVWETLANDFVTEPSVLIAKVDAEAENSKALAQEQGVSSYPTIKYFPKGSTEPLPYTGARAEKDFIDFLNANAGTHRAVGGGLDATGGTIEAFNSIIEKFQGSWADGTEEAKTIAATLQDKYAQYYVRAFEKLSANEGYAANELTRLKGLIAKGNLAPEKMDDLMSRSNILRKFMGDAAEEKSEL
ncbi:histidine kinase hhk19p [Stemphylium lycopersici]|nr:histidine kinase hhk19p [Stemphylium lycopersici]